MKSILAALALLALSACTPTNYDRGGTHQEFERPWDIQQRMERGHYG
jgi:hypothetical protein